MEGTLTPDACRSYPVELASLELVRDVLEACRLKATQQTRLMRTDNCPILAAGELARHDPDEIATVPSGHGTVVFLTLCECEVK